MSQPEANPSVDVKTRRRRRGVFLVGALALMGFLWWMGQPVKPYGEPDPEELARRKSAPQPTYVEEPYADGTVIATARVIEGEEAVMEVLQVRAGTDLKVEVNYLPDQWKDWRELTMPELEAAGYKHGNFSRGARHQFHRNYELGSGHTAELNIGFNADEQLESLTINAMTSPPATIEQPPAKIRVGGEDVPLPIQKTQFAKLFGEPTPPPERPRRGHPPQAEPQPETVTNPAETPMQESEE